MCDRTFMQQRRAVQIYCIQETATENGDHRGGRDRLHQT